MNTRSRRERARTPDDATVEEAMERPLFLSKIERGIADADAGKTLSSDEVRKRLRAMNNQTACLVYICPIDRIRSAKREEWAWVRLVVSF